MSRISAPVFGFGERGQLDSGDAYTRTEAPHGQLALTGPGLKTAPGHLPVRGDLAHIKLAGTYFVPHYAVPMLHRAKPGGATLRAAGRDDAEPVCDLASGEAFEVLDIAGGWAWGQSADDGWVGYVAVDRLEAVSP